MQILDPLSTIYARAMDEVTLMHTSYSCRVQRCCTLRFVEDIVSRHTSI